MIFTSRRYSPYLTSSFHYCTITMSSLSSLYKSFSSPSSGNRKHTPNYSPTEPYFPLTLGGDVGHLNGNPLMPDPRDRDSSSPLAAIPLWDYLVANLNFLAESSCSSLSLYSYSSGKPVSYPWEVCVANPLPGLFASVGMLSMDIMEEVDQ